MIQCSDPQQWSSVVIHSNDHQSGCTPLGHLMECIKFLPSLFTCALFNYSTCSSVGRDSSVGIATRYGLDGLGIESRWGRDFPHLSSPPSLLYNGYRVFPGGKAAGACCWPPTPSSAEVKERVELYLYSPSARSWPVLGWTLPLLLPLTRITDYRHNTYSVEILYRQRFVSFNIVVWYEEVNLLKPSGYVMHQQV